MKIPTFYGNNLLNEAETTREEIKNRRTILDELSIKASAKENKANEPNQHYIHN